MIRAVLPFGKLSNVQVAKLSFWLPFAGLFVMVALGIAQENQNELHLRPLLGLYGIPSLIFVSGLVLSITGLRGMKLEGRKGIFGRALTGLILNTLLLCVSLSLLGFGIYFLAWSARLKAEETSQPSRLIAKETRAADGFASELRALQIRYESSWTALTNPPVLSMAGVTNRAELQTREKKVAEFIAACTAFLEFSQNAAELYRQELAKQKLPLRTQGTQLKIFTNSISAKNPEFIALRQADVRRGQALMKAVTFFDTTWGQWDYIPAKSRVVFKETAEAEEFNSDLHQFNAATDEVLRLKAQITSPGD
jgi:hypothetical protein